MGWRCCFWSVSGRDACFLLVAKYILDMDGPPQLFSQWQAWFRAARQLRMSCTNVTWPLSFIYSISTFHLRPCDLLSLFVTASFSHVGWPCLRPCSITPDGSTLSLLISNSRCWLIITKRFVTIVFQHAQRIVTYENESPKWNEAYKIQSTFSIPLCSFFRWTPVTMFFHFLMGTNRNFPVPC